MAKAKKEIDELLQNIKKQYEEATSSGSIDKEKYVIPPHLHDLQEADLPETQRGLVISEIALFRERSAKRERERMIREQPSATLVPAGPKQREWGKSQTGPYQTPQQGIGKGPQSYDKPVGFVKGSDEGGSLASRIQKTDEELEEERREARRRDEDNSFRDVSTQHDLLSFLV